MQLGEIVVVVGALAVLAHSLVLDELPEVGAAEESVTVEVLFAGSDVFVLSCVTLFCFFYV